MDLARQGAFMTHSTAVCLFLSTLLSLAFSSIRAQETLRANVHEIRYEVVPVGPATEPGKWLDPVDLNTRGELIGTGYVPSAAQFIWDCARGRTEIPRLPNSYDIPGLTAISDAGHVVGYSFTGLDQPASAPAERAFIWDRKRGTRPMLPPAPGELSAAFDVNRFGWAFGTNIKLGPYSITQFLWHEHFGRFDLPKDDLYYVRLNDRGVLAATSSEAQSSVILSYPLLGIRRAVAFPADSLVMSIADLNDRNDVAGVVYIDDTMKGFLARYRGDIDIYDPPAGAPPLFTPMSVNNRRQIVGTNWGRGYGEAFIWDPVNGARNLTQLVTAANENFRSLRFDLTPAINDLGWIATRGFD
jgi:hypothetical protein